MTRVVAAVVAGIGLLVFTAEETSASELSVGAGLKGGFSVYSMTGKGAAPDSGWKKNFLTCFNGGVVATMNFNRSLGVGVEFLYSTKGMKAKENSGAGEVTRRYEYIDVPVLIRVIQVSIPVRQTFFAGPFFGFLQSAEKTTSGTDTSHVGTEDIKDETKPLDIGIVFGFGTEIDAGPGNVIVDVRYNMGLSAIAVNMKTMSFGINVGYCYIF